MQSNHAKLFSIYSRYHQEYGKSIPLCPWCNKPINGRQAHMHHWCVKRSALPKDKIELLNTVENTILVHASCHLEYGQTQEMFEKCKQMALQHLGEDRILGWYNSLPLKEKVKNLANL